jgi:hypothetical protein
MASLFEPVRKKQAAKPNAAQESRPPTSMLQMHEDGLLLCATTGKSQRNTAKLRGPLASRL